MILSSSSEGVSTPSFMQAFSLAQTAFNVQLASPKGSVVEFVNQDEQSRKWLNEFRAKSYAKPISFEQVEASHYAALFIANSIGAIRDLARNAELEKIIDNFMTEKKPICALGLGVTGLFSTTNKDNMWKFKGFSMTATSVFELVRTPYFSALPVIPEDYIREHGAQYSCSLPDALHVVIDRNLITGQNDESVVTAVQNLILFCSQRSVKLSTN